MHASRHHRVDTAESFSALAQSSPRSHYIATVRRKVWRLFSPQLNQSEFDAASRYITQLNTQCQTFANFSQHWDCLCRLSVTKKWIYALCKCVVVAFGNWEVMCQYYSCLLAFRFTNPDTFSFFIMCEKVQVNLPSKGTFKIEDL